MFISDDCAQCLNEFRRTYIQAAIEASLPPGKWVPDPEWLVFWLFGG